MKIDRYATNAALPASFVQSLGGWTNQLGEPIDPELAAGEYWLVALDMAGSPAACLRWRAALGWDTPRYHYHVGRAVHASAELRLFQTQATLLLCNDLTGDAEIADIAVDAAVDEPQRVLADLIGFALRHHHPAGRIVVELQGIRNEVGESPFWQGLGRHFYAGDDRAARLRHGVKWTTHLAALLPRQLLHVPLLGDDAQRAIGKVGAQSKDLQRALAAAGFEYRGHVRIDDGGPVVELGRLSDIDGNVVSAPL